MATEIFSREQFEQALPRHKATGEPLWQYTGMIQGEHTYGMLVKPGVWIQIRSSVDESGMCAGTGEDSIRAIWIGGDNKPLASKNCKPQRWVARTRNWRENLTAMLRTMWTIGLALGPCDKCQQPRQLRKVIKEGPTKGRLFTTCSNDHFVWLQEKEA